MRDNISKDSIGKYLFEKLNVKCLDISPMLDSGVSSNVFSITTLSNQKWFLKVSHEKDVEYAIEGYIINLLRTKGLKAPNVIFLENDSQYFEGSSVIITEKIDGHIVTQESSPKVFDAMIEQLTIINNIEINGFGRISLRDGVLVGEYPNYSSYFYGYVKKYLPSLLEYDFSKDIDIGEFVKKNRQKIDKLGLISAGRLVHGDIPGHVLEIGDNYSGIIDFDDIKSSLPFYDLFEIKLLEPKMYSYINEDLRKKVVDNNYLNLEHVDYVLYLLEEFSNISNTYMRIMNSFDLNGLLDVSKLLKESIRKVTYNL